MRSAFVILSHSLAILERMRSTRFLPETGVSRDRGGFYRPDRLGERCRPKSTGPGKIKGEPG